jgi:urease accessory protein
MILTNIYHNIKDIPDPEAYHIETAFVRSDDMLKSILRVTSDHGRDYGIRLEDESQRLENGTAFLLEPGKLLVLRVLPDEVIVIEPGDIDEMGRIAHMLGNLHKPVQIKNGRIILLTDPVVIQTLKQEGAVYTTEKIQLDRPMEYAHLMPGSHSHHEHTQTKKNCSMVDDGQPACIKSGDAANA